MGKVTEYTSTPSKDVLFKATEPAVKDFTFSIFAVFLSWANTQTVLERKKTEIKMHLKQVESVFENFIIECMYLKI